MQIIPTRVHGILDYAMGLLLIVLPWLLGFADGQAAQWVPVIVGLAVIIYSLFTDYELGLVRLIPMPVHLGIDALGGLFLAASPWLFGFSSQVFWPHLIFGILEIGAALCTYRRPQRAPA